MYANAPLSNSDELRAHVVEWLRANEIQPEDIPPDPTMTIDGDRLTTDVHMRGSEGQKLFTTDGMALERTTRTYTISVPAPPDVAEWLRPRCPTCGR